MGRAGSQTSSLRCNQIVIPIESKSANKFGISLSAFERIKANANLFRTKSLLLRSSSINLSHCNRHESYLHFAFIILKCYQQTHMSENPTATMERQRCPLVFLSTRRQLIVHSSQFYAAVGAYITSGFCIGKDN